MIILKKNRKKKLLLPIRNLDAALNDMFSDLSYSVTKIGTIIYWNFAAITFENAIPKNEHVHYK